MSWQRDRKRDLIRRKKRPTIRCPSTQLRRVGVGWGDGRGEDGRGEMGEESMAEERMGGVRGERGEEWHASVEICEVVECIRVIPCVPSTSCSIVREHIL